MSRVLVTGGLGALGAAVARAFDQAGHDVALIDYAPAPKTMAFPCIGGVNLADPEAAKTAFAQGSLALGGADVLVNAAGGFLFQPVEGDALAWRTMFEANLATCANMCRAAMTGLSNGGAIINIGAAAAEKAGFGMGPYAASKAAVVKLTESLAAELHGRIRVNAVLPLILDTPRNRADMPGVDPANWTAPAAVADVVLFLASDASRAINGASVPTTAPTAR